jgi:methionyl-tRNA formyltransferase
MTVPGRPGLRVLFMGTPGELATAPLHRLLASKHEIAAVAIAGSPSADGPRELPVEPPDEPLAVAARDRGIATLQLRDTGPTVIQRLTRLRPDVIVVACLPLVLPAALLDLPARGCLNLHPSLLPAYRGPAPLFWQLRMGEHPLGVTIHHMTERVDAGDILAQAPVELPDGIGYGEATGRLAIVGGELLTRTLDALARGALAGRPQNEADGSWFPWPRRRDFEIPSSWDARRAFNFMRGTRDWNHPFEIVTPSRRIVAADAHSFIADGSATPEYAVDHDLLCIRFNPGILRIPLPADWNP